MIHKILCVAAVVLFVSCNDNGKPESKEKPAITTDSTAKDPGLARFELIENIFQNDNWLLTNGKDSSYLYCSRLGKAFVKTYHFRMLKGDSVNTVITSMHLSGDTIQWPLPFDTITLQLKNSSAGILIWTDTKRSEGYSFEKKDSTHIDIKYPDGKMYSLLKTPTLSAFLVRSKYDYLHGTKLAFSFER